MHSGPPSQLHVVTGATAFRILMDDQPGCIEVVRQAYLAHRGGRSVNPASVFLRFPARPGARIIALPAHLADPWNVAGIKWIASFPENVDRGFPRASAVLILNRDEDGYPFAMLEASAISAARTAASAALAAECLGGGTRRAKALGIVGNGPIAGYVHRFLLASGWTIDELFLYDLVPDRARRFHDRVRGHWPGGVHIASGPEELVGRCDLILFATVADRPYLHEARIFAHRPLVLHLSLRDLAPEILLTACNIVDDVDHVMQAATSVHLAGTMSGNRDFIAGTLADVIEGRCAVDRSKPIIFSPFGLGILDIAVAQWVYERALALGQTLAIDSFFGTGEA